MSETVTNAELQSAEAYTLSAFSNRQIQSFSDGLKWVQKVGGDCSMAFDTFQVANAKVITQSDNQNEFHGKAMVVAGQHLVERSDTLSQRGAMKVLNVVESGCQTGLSYGSISESLSATFSKLEKAAGAKIEALLDPAFPSAPQPVVSQPTQAAVRAMTPATSKMQ